MPSDLRCPSRLHAVLLEGGLVEVKCRSDRCGASSTVTVLHRFDVSTGVLVDTVSFRNPAR